MYYQLAVLLTEPLSYFIIYDHIEILHKNTIRKMRLYKFIGVFYSHPLGEIEEDPQSAIMFDKMEKTLQKYKLELQQRNIPQPKTPPRKGMIEFPAFNGPKKNQNQDLGDLEDSCYQLTN